MQDICLSSVATDLGVLSRHAKYYYLGWHLELGALEIFKLTRPLPQQCLIPGVQKIFFVWYPEFFGTNLSYGVRDSKEYQSSTSSSVGKWL